jgi:hypothetical protein
MLLGEQGDNKRTQRTSNLSPQAQAQLQQAKQLAPSGVEISAPEATQGNTAAAETSSGGGMGSMLGILNMLGGQSGQSSSSNIAQMKRQQYQQYLNNLYPTIQSYGINQSDTDNIFRLLGY